MHYVKRSICIISYISQRFIFVSVRRVPSLWYYSLQNKEDCLERMRLRLVLWEIPL